MDGHWNLMTSHGLVLFYIAAYPDSTMREIAHALEITERRVTQVIADLDEGGLLQVNRTGRRNSYAVKPDATFRHPTLSHITLLDFERLLTRRDVEEHRAVITH